MNRSNRSIASCQSPLILLLLLLTVAPGPSPVAPTCHNRLDLVLVVDTATSQTGAAFDDVKSQVKSIVSVFTVGQLDTRLALVSVAGGAARVLARFDSVGSLADFNSAVDRLAYSASGPTATDLAAGMRAARQDVLNGARTQSISKVLLLVKDRRPLFAAVADAAGRARIAAEAAAVKSAGVAVQAVGIGGIWFRVELVALFGTEYLLFKDKNKAAEAIRSLNNPVCEAACPDNGKTLVRRGLCNAGTRQVVTTSVQLGVDASGLSVCRRQIGRRFESCFGMQRCNSMDRIVGPCTQNGKVTVTSTWQVFDFKTQQCITNKLVSVVNCKDSLKCAGHVADVIFILDRSSSLHGLFDEVRRATQALIQPMDVGPSTVRVGLMTYENTAQMAAALGSTNDMSTLSAALNRIPSHIDTYGKLTYTNRALDAAIVEFRNNGRRSVPRFVFLITDGQSTKVKLTFASASAIKNYGVSLFAIGVGNVNVTELKTITEPESATNLITVRNVAELERWAVAFPNRLCIRMAAPDPKLCDGNEFVQAISECNDGRQQITRTDYIYDSSRQCIKSIQSRLLQGCKSKCIDPINGNEHFEGDSWQTWCHDFVCHSSPAKPFVPQKSYCMSADLKCLNVGSARFKCNDDKGVESNNCQCLKINGKPTVVVDTF